MGLSSLQASPVGGLGRQGKCQARFPRGGPVTRGLPSGSLSPLCPGPLVRVAGTTELVFRAARDQRQCAGSRALGTPWRGTDHQQVLTPLHQVGGSPPIAFFFLTEGRLLTSGWILESCVFAGQGRAPRSKPGRGGEKQ